MAQGLARAVDLVLAGHDPYPAIAIDRHWTLVAGNLASQALLAGVDAALLEPPINVLRLSLHPGGLAPRIVNLDEWRAHLLTRLRRNIDVSADPVLIALLEELRSYPTDHAASATRRARLTTRRDFGGVVVPLLLQVGDAVLSFFSTTTVFGTPLDITLSELAIEAFFPADAATGQTLRELSAG